MTDPHYREFGLAVAGILDGYHENAGDHTVEERNAALAFTVQLAAEAYGIELKDND